MSVKSLSITEWYNTTVIKSMAHWWKPLHLQYYDPGVNTDFPGKIRSDAQLAFNNAFSTIALQLTCMWSSMLLASASVASEQLLWLNKQRSMTADEETETEVRSKNTPTIINYCHRCRERQQNENLRDFKFKMTVEMIYPLRSEQTESQHQGVGKFAFMGSVCSLGGDKHR